MSSYSVNAPHVSMEKFDDEVMIVNLEKGNYYSLTGTGAEIWEMIETGMSEESILACLLASYDGDTETIESTLAGFASELQAEALIVSSETSPAQTPEPPIAAEKMEFTVPQLEKYTDMQELLLIDPIHEVNDEHGWPKMKR